MKGAVKHLGSGSSQDAGSYRLLSLLVGTAFFMEQLDATIIAPAIPQIASTFNVDPLSLNLTMTVYLLCSVVFIPTGAFLISRYGTRTVFKAALALFIFSSTLCGLSHDLVTLTMARALQGGSAALMVPVGRIAIVHTTKRSELVKALAWMITPAMVGPLVGPLLGGLIATWFSWRWIFLINLPIGLVGYVVACAHFPQIQVENKRPFDLKAWLLLALQLGSLVVALESTRHQQLPSWLYIMLGAVAALALLCYRSHTSTHPLLDFRLLGVRTFGTSFWAGTLVRVGYGALPFLLPLLLQIGLGFSAIESGLVLLASGAVAFVTKTCTAGILRRYGFRRVLVWNGAFCAVALATCGFFTGTWGALFIAATVSAGGFFRSIQFNALAAVAYADLPPEKIATATALNTTFQQLAVMTGISISVVIVELSTRFGHRAQPTAIDFSMAFAVLSLVALAAVPFCLRLRPESGAELSGHDATAGDPASAHPTR
jgi:EmrB/QacA subfamily drug resistance transporter